MPKLKIFLSLFILLLGLFMFNIRVAAATVTWTGASSNWETGSNWSGGVAPGPDDDVYISTAVTVTINAPTTVNSVTVGDGTVASVLNFNYDAFTTGALTIDSGNFTLAANAQLTHANSVANTTIKRIYIVLQQGSVNLSGTVNLTQKGYLGTYGPGASANTGAY